MATITAQAKIYNAFRLLCVDKNITANITASFSLGNYNRPIQPNDEFIVSPNVLAFRLVSAIADVETNGSIALTNERLKTFGGGNKVGVVNPAQPWTATAALRCKFPTYVRFDLEALGVPEGTNLILQMEEGFVIEGDYPGTGRKPLPRIANLMTFRTPKKFAVYPSASFTVPNLDPSERRRPFAGDVGSLFTPVTIARANKVGFIELEGFTGIQSIGNFAPAQGRSNFVPASFTIPGFNFRARLFDSTFETSTFTLPDIADGWRTRLFSSVLTSDTASNIDAEKFKGTFWNVQSETNAITQNDRLRDTVTNTSISTSASATARVKGPLRQTFRNWTALTTAPDGTIYATATDGGIYRRLTTENNFVSIANVGQAVRGIMIATDGAIWITTATFIYRAPAGTTNFQSTNSPNRPNWRHIAQHPDGTVYAVTGGGSSGADGNRSLYKLRPGQSSWDQQTLAPFRDWWGVKVYGNHIYVSVQGGDIHRFNHDPNASSFGGITNINLDTKSFNGIYIDGTTGTAVNTIMYAATSTIDAVEPGDGHIWRLTDISINTANSFVRLASEGTYPNDALRQWTDITVTPSKEIFACVYGGDIHCVGFTG